MCGAICPAAVLCLVMLYGVRRCVVLQFGGAGRVRCHLPGGCPLCLVMLYGVRRCVVLQFGGAGRVRCHLPGGCPLSSYALRCAALGGVTVWWCGTRAVPSPRRLSSV